MNNYTDEVTVKFSYNSVDNVAELIQRMTTWPRSIFVMPAGPWAYTRVTGIGRASSGTSEIDLSSSGTTGYG